MCNLEKMFNSSGWMKMSRCNIYSRRIQNAFIALTGTLFIFFLILCLTVLILDWFSENSQITCVILLLVVLPFLLMIVIILSCLITHAVTYFKKLNIDLFVLDFTSVSWLAILYLIGCIGTYLWLDYAHIFDVYSYAELHLHCACFTDFNSLFLRGDRPGLPSGGYWLQCCFYFFVQYCCGFSECYFFFLFLYIFIIGASWIVSIRCYWGAFYFDTHNDEYWRTVDLSKNMPLDVGNITLTFNLIFESHTLIQRKDRILSHILLEDVVWKEKNRAYRLASWYSFQFLVVFLFIFNHAFPGIFIDWWYTGWLLDIGDRSIPERLASGWSTHFSW